MQPGSRICVTLTERDATAAIREMERLSNMADLFEIRADYLDDPSPEPLAARKPKPLIYTLRRDGEGGRFRGSDDDRLALFARALAAGFDYIDIEDDAPWRKLSAAGRGRLIVSHHDFARTPTDLFGIYRRLRESPADVIKIATMANSLYDAARIFDLLEKASGDGRRLAALAMGPMGMATRILGPSRGAPFTYAAARAGSEAAPGQIPVQDMVDLYRVGSIDRSTAIYGLIGRPTAHSLSPRVHNAAFAELEMNAVYIPFETDSLGSFFSLNNRVGGAGFSVTIPYKAEIVRLMDALDPTAEKIGAVNTVAIREERKIGYNTDAEGFVRPLERRIALRGKRAVVLGAGGAARAAAFALLERGVEVLVLSRNRERARELALGLGANCGGLEELARHDFDLLINATPVGMFPNVDESPAPAELLAGKIVYDLVYNPPETKLLREARGAGALAISGIEMFLEQAAAQFRIWTGVEPPKEAMRRALFAPNYTNSREFK